LRDVDQLTTQRLLKAERFVLFVLAELGLPKLFYSAICSVKRHQKTEMGLIS
jgi:hypothetical protein